MVEVWPPDMGWLPKWSTIYMMTPGNWARPETWLEIVSLIFLALQCKIQGIFFAKKVVGHNFWTEGPTDLRLTFLSCIFDALFGDTPLDHIFSHMPICPYAHYGHIWPTISNIISSQVSGRAQLPGVIIYTVDHFGNYFISGGHTCTSCCHPNVHQPIHLYHPGHALESHFHFL